ncbi:uncharacterized protein LOC116253929 isoform X7 [Nymphaea colorata]|uniref:uncharacterized protein LOC116253929 isoform X6 n=1 Tax=Nymphaea colorata TaxID=210225 RepID=UPI00214F4C84|nr:uncharacterized protein LOC116253929 isoform X6 [Nymphaea colorata]XP_049933798.1 uncharacterized protein LOC116253929 isoform X7 [Nymphaea colorata]
MHDGVLGVSLCFKRFSDLRTKRETSHHPRRLNSSDIHIAGAASEIDASGCLVSIYGLVKQVEHIDFWTELCLFVHFQGTRITSIIVGGIQVVRSRAWLLWREIA